MDDVACGISTRALARTVEELTTVEEARLEEDDADKLQQAESRARMAEEALARERVWAAEHAAQMETMREELTRAREEILRSSSTDAAVPRALNGDAVVQSLTSASSEDRALAAENLADALREQAAVLLEALEESREEAEVLAGMLASERQAFRAQEKRSEALQSILCFEPWRDQRP